MTLAANLRRSQKVPCLSSAIAAICTPASDTGCACASQGAIGQAGLSCLLSSCNGTDLGKAQSAGAQICVDYSATATGIVASTSSANHSTTASITGSTTGSAATATSGRTTTSGSSTSATGSSASATSSAGANGMNGAVAAQAGLLGAMLAGVAALL